jgi:hypothetical protein
VIESPIYAPAGMRGTTDEKLLAKIDGRIAYLEERIKYALGNAGEIAACAEELQVLQWAKAGSGTMKRYSVVAMEECCEMQERPDGEWVRFDDVAIHSTPQRSEG